MKQQNERGIRPTLVYLTSPVEHAPLAALSRVIAVRVAQVMHVHSFILHHILADEPACVNHAARFVVARFVLATLFSVLAVRLAVVALAGAFALVAVLRLGAAGFASAVAAVLRLAVLARLGVALVVLAAPFALAFVFVALAPVLGAPVFPFAVLFVRLMGSICNAATSSSLRIRGGGAPASSFTIVRHCG